MQMSRRGSGPVAPAIHASHGPVHGARSLRQRRRPGRLSQLIAASLFTATFCITSAEAASFGHSRILSAPGEPLLLEIPVAQLDPQEIDSLRAMPAPAEAWRAAGMTPPVPLESMRLVLLDGLRPDVKVIQLRSSHPVSQPIVDVLIDVRSVTGQQRYQVSLVAHADTNVILRPESGRLKDARVIDGKGALVPAAGQAPAGRQIVVRPGDTLFAIARRNAVEGVSVYQMMIALQRSNPHAFIQDNVNLVRAGATLSMPGMDVLTALSDREARRIFQQHAQAFALWRQRGGTVAAAAASTVAAAAQGEVAATTPEPAGIADASATAQSGDVLKLSGTRAPMPDGAGGHGAGVNAGGDGAGGNGRGSAPVSLLAASGALASDAATHDASELSASGSQGNSDAGSDANSGAAGATAGAVGTLADSDDEAARQKRIEESKKRILELEDNVRHLNQALQKQGHVAAEAALEGARSVTDVIKEVINLVDSEQEGEPAEGTASSTSGPSAESASSAGGNAAAGSGHSAAGTGTAPASPGAADSREGSAAPAGSSGGSAVGSAGGSGASDAAPGAGSAGGASAGSSAAVGSGADSGASGSASARDASLSASSASSSPASRAAPEKASGSWLKENMMWLIGAGIGLLVLIVAWLLRRMSASREDRFENDSPISDTMLQEKLREIDLDLDRPPGDSRRGS